MSKKMCIFIAIIAVIMIPLVCFAETTGGADWGTDLGGLNGIRDFAFGHTAEYTDANTQRARKWQVGAGIDLIILERTAEQNNLTPLIVTSETRVDFNNKFNGTQYFVVTYRLSEVWAGLVDLVGMRKNE